MLDEVNQRLAVSVESDWTSMTPQQVGTILRREIESLRNEGRFVNRIELESLFLPTAEIQEIAMASGWSDDFLRLAERFDESVKRVP